MNRDDWHDHEPVEKWVYRNGKRYKLTRYPTPEEWAEYERREMPYLIAGVICGLCAALVAFFVFHINFFVCVGIWIVLVIFIGIILHHILDPYGREIFGSDDDEDE